MGGSASSSSYQEPSEGSQSCAEHCGDAQQNVNPFFYRPRMTPLDWVKVRKGRKVLSVVCKATLKLWFYLVESDLI